MVWDKYVKTKIIFFVVFAGLLLWGILQFICATWYDEKELNNGYYLTIWERNYYVIDYRKCRLSTKYNMVLHEPILKLEFNSEYVFARTKTGDYWIIDKTITPIFTYDSLDNKYYCSALWGPLDSAYFYHFRDSVHFISKPQNRWPGIIK